MIKHKCTPVGVEYFDSAPYVFTATETFKTTPARLFEYFEDAHSWTVWADPIQKVEWTSPKPFSLGTTRTVYMSGGMTGWEEFIAWEPGKRMAFCFTEMSKPMNESFAEDYQVVDLGNGQCQLTWRMAMTPKGFSKIIMPLSSPFMKFMLGRWLKSFRDYVEKDDLIVDNKASV